MIVGILAVIFAVRPWVIIPTLFLGIIFLWLRSFYMHSSRDIKRMEGIAKSPVFSHFSTSLQGNNRKLVCFSNYIISSIILFCTRIDNNQIIFCGAAAQIRV